MNIRGATILLACMTLSLILVGRSRAAEIPPALAGLAADEPGMRLVAESAMAARGGEALADVEAGLAAFHPDVVRAGCVAVLGRMLSGPSPLAGEEAERARALLVAALEDATPPVRRRAALALAEIGDGRGLETILQGVESDDDLICWECARALRGLGTSQVDLPRPTVPALIENLRRSDLRVREETLRCLEALTGQSFGFVLRAPDEYFPEAQALGAIHAEAEQEKQEIEEASVEWMKDAHTPEEERAVDARKRAELVDVDARRIERIHRLRTAQVLDREEEWREALLRWKRWWQRTQNQGRLRWLTEGLTHHDLAIRMLAAETLGHLAAPETIDALATALGDAEPLQREKVAWALGQFPDVRVVGILVPAMARNYPDHPLVVQEIGRSLSVLTQARYPAYPRYWEQWWERAQRHGPPLGGDERPFVPGEWLYLPDVATDTIWAVSVAPGGAREPGGAVTVDVRRWIPGEGKWFCHSWQVSPGQPVAQPGVHFEPVDAQGYRTLMEIDFDTGLTLVGSEAAERVLSAHPRQAVPAVRVTLSATGDPETVYHLWAGP